MRPALGVLLAALLGLSVAPLPAAPSAASCAGPSLEIPGADPAAGPPTLVRGETVTVTGRGFVDGCDDTGGGSSAFGCSGDDDGETEAPLTDIELVALQGGPTMTQTALATADAEGAEDDHLGWVTWTFTVPDTLRRGPAYLKTVGSEPLRVRIR